MLAPATFICPVLSCAEISNFMLRYTLPVEHKDHQCTLKSSLLRIQAIVPAFQFPSFGGRRPMCTQISIRTFVLSAYMHTPKIHERRHNSVALSAFYSRIYQPSQLIYQALTRTSQQNHSLSKTTAVHTPQQDVQQRGELAPVHQ